MKLKEIWNSYSAGRKALILLRDLPLYLVLLFALTGLIWEIDNSMLVLICLPVSALAQTLLSWKQDRKTALFFLFSACFVVVVYIISAA